MPVIFASAILMFPQQIFQMLYSWTQIDFLQTMANFLGRGGWVYYLTYGSLILIFSYFWVSIMFKPVQIADDLKRTVVTFQESVQEIPLQSTLISL